MQVAPLDDERLVVADISLAERSQPGEQAAARLDHYVALRGWRGGEIEDGAVVTKPLPRGGDFAAFWRIGGARVAKLGLRGGFVHPVTGRTLADAANAAMLLTRQQDFSGAALHDLFEEEARRLWRARDYMRGLSRSLAEGEDRTAQAGRPVRARSRHHHPLPRRSARHVRADARCSARSRAADGRENSCSPAEAGVQ